MRKWLFRLWLILAVSLRVGAAENAPGAELSTNAPMRGGRLQIWDAGKALSFTPDQTKQIELIHTNFTDALQRFRNAMRAKDLEPEKKAASRREYRLAISNFNTQVETILTAEQKVKFKELQTGKKTAAAAETKTEGAKTDSPSDDVPDRPPLTTAEYEKLAADLRQQYSQPPAKWPKPEIDAGVNFVELGLLPEIPYPTNNPFSEKKADLGKMLFFDPRLSGTGQMACASCHEPELGWGDGRTVAFGENRKELKRNVPTLLNIGLGKHFFRDGRSSSLEAQAREVMLNPDEMHGVAVEVPARLEKLPGYRRAFAEVFGDEKISMERITQALATFERGITSRRNAFDQFLKGDTNALSDAAIRGLHLFRTAARCANCHYGPNLTDEEFHNIGLSYYGRKYEDLGRYDVTKRPEDVGAFKTPTLRNITRTGPYMHNGLFELQGVLNLYNAGMPTLHRTEAQKGDPLFPTKSKLLHPLGLNDRGMADLKAFLESLEEARLRIRPPELPSETDSKKVGKDAE